MTVAGLLAVVFVLMQVGPGAPIVTPPNTTTTTTVVQNQVTVQAPPPDPAAIADASVQSSEAILAMVVAPTPVAWADSLLDLPDLWRTTPADLTYNHPAIRGLSEQMRLAAFALIALALLVMGASYALGRTMELEFGRLLFAVVLALGSLTFWEIGVQLNNAICGALAAPDLPGLIRPHLDVRLDPAGSVGTVVLVIVYAMVALLTLFALLARLGVLMILIAIAPLPLLLYALEQTEGLAHVYTRTAVGLLFSQVLIVIGLKLASVLNGVGSGLGGTLLGIVVLLIIGRLPGLVASGVRGGGLGGALRTLHYARRLLH